MLGTVFLIFYGFISCSNSGDSLLLKSFHLYHRKCPNVQRLSACGDVRGPTV